MKPESRRSFLRSGTLAALAIGGCALGAPRLSFGQSSTRTNPAADFQLPFETTQNPIYYYTQETFEPYVGGIFRGRGGGRTVSLELLRVTGQPTRRPQLMRRATARATRGFTLVFRADGPLSEITTIHPLEHAALGRFDIFLSPRGAGQSNQLFYEAVFNHLA